MTPSRPTSPRHGHRALLRRGAGPALPTDRVHDPQRFVDRWCSGKDRHHSANIQVLATPDGWPICSFPVQPGSTHDLA